MSFLTKFFRPFTSMSSAPAQPMNMPEGAKAATVAAGCFWGVEHMYRREFGKKGLYDARVGYIGGDIQNPGYRAVCSGRTGRKYITLWRLCARSASQSPLERIVRRVETTLQDKHADFCKDAEALQVVYDPTKIEYRSLLEFFYKMHDPTTENRQGPDVGTQYRSAIFYHDDEQEKIAKEITKKVDEQWWKGGVSTEVLPAGQWWDAEAYHQKYLDVNPGGYECPSHFLRSFPPLS